jgi:hypothetical protein
MRRKKYRDGCGVDDQGNAFTYSPELKCSWYGLEVTTNDCVVLYLRENDCCHAPGAIAIARRALPGVRFVQTYSGARKDTGYRLTEGGYEVTIPARLWG